MTSPEMKPRTWYTIASSARGPIADMLLLLKDGAMLEKMRPGSDTFSITCDSPRDAAGVNMPFFETTKPRKKPIYLFVVP